MTSSQLSWEPWLSKISLERRSVCVWAGGGVYKLGLAEEAATSMWNWAGSYFSCLWVNPEPQRSNVINDIRQMPRQEETCQTPQGVSGHQLTHRAD